MTVDSYLGRMISDLAPGTILCCYKKPLLSKMVPSGSGYFRFDGASGMDNVQRNMGHFVPQFSITMLKRQIPNKQLHPHQTCCCTHGATCLLLLISEVVRLGNYSVYRCIGCIIDQCDWSGPFSPQVMTFDLELSDLGSRSGRDTRLEVFIYRSI